MSLAIGSLADFAEGHDLDLDHVVVIGHGSGGHLALQAAVARSEVPISAVVALAPIGDLEAAHQAGVGDGAVEAFMRRTPDQSPERHVAASPIMNLPIGVPLLVVHGDEDQHIPAAISRSFAGRAADEGDTVIYHDSKVSATKHSPTRPCLHGRRLSTRSTGSGSESDEAGEAFFEVLVGQGK